MSKYLSDKLTILSTILIIMVIYVHSCYQEAEQYSTALFLQKLTSNICSIANCLFFAFLGICSHILFNSSMTFILNYKNGFIHYYYPTFFGILFLSYGMSCLISSLAWNNG